MNNTDMVLIEPVSFTMGSSLFKNEQPVRIVRLNAFWVDLFPVTNERFADFINKGGYLARQFWTAQGWGFIQKNQIKEPLYWHDELWNQASQPVTGVSWWEAMAFATFEGKKLPTEAQWEFMAGGGQHKYPWGDKEPDETLANFANDCEPSRLLRSSKSVDFFERSRSHCGCWDVAGNLNEWCLDNVSQNYSWDLSQQNPVFITDENEPHMVRGGSGLHDADCLRCASRDYYSPTVRDNIVGFRCVRNIKMEGENE